MWGQVRQVERDFARDDLRDRGTSGGLPSFWGDLAHRAQATGELAQEVMLIKLHAGLVLIEQGELELLHLLKVVVEDELLGEGRAKVVDGRFCSVVLAEGRGMGHSQGSWFPLLGP